MTQKQQVIDFFGSASEAAKFFDIRPQAVIQWRDTIPLVRQYQLALAYPDKFKISP